MGQVGGKEENDDDDDVGQYSNFYRAYRLKPGQLVKQTLHSLLEGVPNATVVSAVGSLSSCILRLADGVNTHNVQVNCELVSFVGTFSSVDASDAPRMSSHLHASLADEHGRVIGGHFVEGTVHTTLEIVVLICPDLLFSREFDQRTGYGELVVSTLNAQNEYVKEEDGYDTMATVSTTAPGR